MKYTSILCVLACLAACKSDTFPVIHADFAVGWAEVRERPADEGRAFEMRIHVPELEAARQQSLDDERLLVRQEADYYFTHQLGNHIWLVNGSDSINPSVCHVEYDAGMRPWRTALLEFDAELDFGDHLTLRSPVTLGEVVCMEF